MVKRLQSKLLLSPKDFSPSHPDFRVIGVFNPGAARFGDEIILLVRVAQGVAQDQPGWLKSPRSRRIHGKLEYCIDTLEISPDDDGDHRKPLLVDGHRRLAFISHLEMVRLAKDGCTVQEICRLDQLFGSTDYEEYGVEDARITQLGDTYYITYVGVSDKMGVSTCLMSTTDFIEFRRHGPIFPCENKDVVIFPEIIGGRYYAFHRPVGRINIRKPAIMLASSPDLESWGRHRYVLGCSSGPGWYSGRIGAGTPPLRTDQGWLSIFHGVKYCGRNDPTGTYTAGAMLNDLETPEKLLAASPAPFLRSETEFELNGYVKNVVFPTGIVSDLEDPGLIHVYYGCADTCIAGATFSTGEILASLK